MVTPIFAPFPAAPSRAEGRDDFSPSADTFAAALPPFALKMNLAITWMAETITAVSGSQSAAADSASAAAQSASTANTAKLAAQKAVTDASTAGAAQVQLAKDQVALSVAAKESAQAAAAAAQAAAGMPSIAGKAFMALRVNAAGTGIEWAPGVPNTLVGKTGQSIMLGADKVPYWGYAGQQIGDLLITSRNPGSLYLPANGSIRSQAAYPALFASVGLIGGAIGTAWADYDFGGTNTGFAASPSGTIIVVQSPTLIRRSSDRGQTWANIAITNLGNTPSDIKTDGNGTWIVLSSANSAPFQCLRSTDDGLTWQVVTLPATSSGAGGSWTKLLYCGNNVWIATGNYTLTMLRSTNGGASWATFTHGYDVSNAPQTLAANGTGTILICAYNGSNYTVKKSTDYGASFINFLTLSAQSNCMATDGQGTWIIGLGGANALRSFDDAASSSGFTAFTITGGVGGNSDIIFVGGLILYMFTGSGSKVIIHAPNGSVSPQGSAANVVGRFGNAGNGTIFAGSTTANRLSRSVQQFGYDTATQFALPNPQPVIGVTAYIKALEAA